MKFWLDNYQKQARELEEKFHELRREVVSECRKLQFSLDKKLDSAVIEESFETLQGLLSVKFKQVEDVKDGLRDMLVYQKYFYPIKVQGIIT